MKRIKANLFSNGTEHMTWTGLNCEKCVKMSRYNESKDTYSQFRCSIDKDIQEQCAGLTDEVNVKSYEAVRQLKCPYIQTERKVKLHRKIKNQQTLEFNDKS